MTARALLLLLALAAGLAAPAQAEMWRYEGPDGTPHFTNDRYSIPPELRGSAKPYSPKQPSTSSRDINEERNEILEKRREIIAGFSEEQAQEAFEKGLLTESEVQYLVDKGALRLSGAAASYRAAGAPPEENAPAAGAENVQLSESQLQDLRRLAKGPAQVNAFKEFLSDVKSSPKFKWSLIAEGVLIAVLIIALPFVMRNYNDDGTRRIIRLSFIFIFVIVSATGNLVLFKDEIYTLFSMKRKAEQQSVDIPQSPPAAQGAPAKLPTRAWDHNRY